MKIEPFLLERWMTRHETNVRYDIAESGILPLSTADLLAFEPEPAREATRERLLAIPLGYSEARGTDALRTMLAETYVRGDADHVLVTTGAIEANFLLFNVLLDAGDHVIAPYPAYQQLYSVPRAIGCDVSLWPVGPETGYRYDVDRLAALIRPTTKVIIVNTPHNPTGAMLSPADAERVYDLAASVGATVIGDEAYRWLAVPEGEPFAPPMFDLGPAGVQHEGFDGTVGWASDPAGGYREKSGVELVEARRSAAFPRELQMKTLYPTMTVKGREKVGARDAFVVSHTAAPLGRDDRRRGEEAQDRTDQAQQQCGRIDRRERPVALPALDEVDEWSEDASGIRRRDGAGLVAERLAQQELRPRGPGRQERARLADRADPRHERAGRNHRVGRAPGRRHAGRPAARAARRVRVPARVRTAPLAASTVRRFRRSPNRDPFPPLAARCAVARQVRPCTTTGRASPPASTCSSSS